MVSMFKPVAYLATLEHGGQEDGQDLDQHGSAFMAH